jgi:hypothetical protein
VNEAIDVSTAAQQKAATEIRRSDVRDRVRRPGRPPERSEIQERYTHRWEPSLVAELQKMSGCDVKEFVERMHGVLNLASEYQQARVAAQRARAALEEELQALGFPPLDTAS